MPSCFNDRFLVPDSAENLRVPTGAVLGADRGVPRPQIMEVFVEVIQLVRDEEQIVAPSN